jgi:hypothetical protein
LVIIFLLFTSGLSAPSEKYIIANKKSAHIFVARPNRTFTYRKLDNLYLVGKR